jgi:hypothetical protein
MSDIELPPRLRVEGSRLIKPNGHEWTGHGVSFGNFWLDVPQDAIEVQALGLNTVRICLRWWGKFPTKSGKPQIDSRDNNAFSFIARQHFQNWLDLITQASAAGLWVVPFIDSNCGQSGIQDPGTMAYCDPYGVFGAHGRNFWSDRPMRKMFATLWQTAAEALRMLPRIAMLEIQPEPLDGRGPEWAGPVRDFYNYMADAIRDVDSDTPFLVGARDSYKITFCEEAYTAHRDDFVYTGNLLSGWVNNPQKFDQGLAALVDMRDRLGVPVWVQQLGRKSADDPGNVNMRDALAKMNAARVGWAWWAWKQNTPDPGAYSLNYRTPDETGWIAKEDEQALIAEFA